MSYTYLGRKEPREEWTVSTTKVFYSICQNTFGRQNHALGLSAGTVITKESKNPNNRVLLRALLFGYIVSFVVRNLCLGTYTDWEPNPSTSVALQLLLRSQWGGSFDC